MKILTHSASSKYTFITVTSLIVSFTIGLVSVCFAIPNPSAYVSVSGYLNELSKNGRNYYMSSDHSWYIENAGNRDILATVYYGNGWDADTIDTLNEVDKFSVMTNPKHRSHELEIHPPPDQPYLMASTDHIENWYVFPDDGTQHRAGAYTTGGYYYNGKWKGEKHDDDWSNWF